MPVEVIVIPFAASTLMLILTATPRRQPRGHHKENRPSGSLEFDSLVSRKRFFSSLRTSCRNNRKSLNPCLTSLFPVSRIFSESWCILFQGVLACSVYFRVCLLACEPSSGDQLRLVFSLVLSVHVCAVHIIAELFQHRFSGLRTFAY